MKRTFIILFACLSMLTLLALPPNGALAAPRLQGTLTAVPDSNAKSGQAGTSVIYTVTVTNGEASDNDSENQLHVWIRRRRCAQSRFGTR